MDDFEKYYTFSNITLPYYFIYVTLSTALKKRLKLLPLKIMVPFIPPFQSVIEIKCSHMFFLRL